MRALDLFVMVGQSHMLGYMSDAAAYPPDEADAGIPFFWLSPGESDSGGQWTTLKPQPGRFPQGHFGPEVSFARAALKAGLRPAIFKCAVNRTSLAEDWKGPGEDGIYDRMLRNLDIALAGLAERGEQVRLRAFVWVQGESDAWSREHADAYRGRLQRLVDHFRTLVIDPAFVLSMDASHPAAQLHPQVMHAQRDMSRADPRIAFVSMAGLPRADESHLLPEGVIEHGQRLFGGYVETLKRMRR